MLLSTAPAVAAAQFTTFIAPPNPVKDSIKASVVAEQKAIADSATRAQISNLKSWVDSTAGIAVPPADTTLVANTANGTIDTIATPRGGMMAPATASPLPVLLAGGLALMIFGI